MGNCLNFFTSSEDDDDLLPRPLPSSPLLTPAILPSCVSPIMSKRLPSTAPLNSTPSKRRSVRFVPILPFRTPSDLAALYELGAELGRGQFGIIRKCINRTSGVQFACKSIPKLRLRTIQDIKDVVREIDIMKRLSSHIPLQGCPAPAGCNVVRLNEVIEDSLYVHLVMELCNGGELFDRIVRKKCFPEAEAAMLMKSLLETLQFCHGIGIMHRDLKPENLLFVDRSEESALKLADFGLAVQFSRGQKFATMAGSAYYIAPEVLQGEYSEEIDMWSVGVIMYVLLSGMPPFWGPTEEGIFNAIQEGQVDLASEPWQVISSTAKDLISHMLCVDVKLRWTAAQALEHPWIVLHTTKASTPLPHQIADQGEDMIITREVELIPDRLVVSPHDMLTFQEHAKAESLGSLTSAILVHLCESSALDLGESNRVVQAELKQLMVALVAALDKERLSFSESLSKVRLRAGWTCLLLTTSATEETLMVDMGQEKYLIAHDRLRKRLGWKILKPHYVGRTQEKLTFMYDLQKLLPVF